MKNDLGSFPNETLDGGIKPPLSCIVGNSVGVGELVRCLIWFYFPKCEVIYDPTCGEENFQFRDWIKNSKYTYIASDIKKTKWAQFVADVTKPPLPLRERSVDVIVYDPPYLPNAHHDDRGEDYDIYGLRTPLQIFGKYYSETVFREFHRICRQGLIVKCSDFYYPKESNNLYCPIPVVLKNTEKYFKLVAIHIYRFFYTNIPLYQYRLRHIAKKYRRCLISHTYYLVFYKNNVG